VFQAHGYNDRLESGLRYGKSIIYPFTWQSLLSIITPFATVKYPEFFNTDISMRNMHMGLILVIAFLAGIFRKRSGLQWLILSFGLLCLLAAFGPLLPVHKLIFRFLPFVNMLRMPAYFNIFTIFSVILIAGIQIPELSNPDGRYRKWLQIIAALTAGLLVLLLVYSLVHTGRPFPPLSDLFRHPDNFFNSLDFHYHIIIQALLQLILAGFLYFCLRSGRPARQVFRVIAVLVCIEMVLAVNLNSYFTVYSKVRPRDISTFMNSQPAGFPVPDNRPVALNSDKLLTHDPLWRNIGILTKRISFDGFSSFILKPYNFLCDSLPHFKDSLLTNSPVYLSGRVHNVTELKHPGISFSAEDLFVDDSVNLLFPAALKKGHASARIDLLAFDPDKLTVHCNTDSASVITMMQSDYPGWQVKIDGNEVPHFTSNLMYVSAVVPSGGHEIIFEYHNRVVIICFIISYTLFVLLIAFLFYLRFRTFSKLKAGLLPVLTLFSAMLCVFAFFSNETADQKKNKTYHEFSDSMVDLEKKFPHDSFIGLFNLDDTAGFNRMLDNGKEMQIKYFRFNETRDMGEFYRFILASGADHLVYGYSNLYNPPETEWMIREMYPYMDNKSVSALGTLSVYSKSGNGEPLKVVFRTRNDFRSPTPGWIENLAGYEDTVTGTGKGEKMDSATLYSSTFRKQIGEITDHEELYIIVTADIFLVGNSNPLLVYDEKNGDHPGRWISLDVHKFVHQSNQWGKVFFAVRTNKNQSQQDISIYFWNADKGSFYIDNFKIEGISLMKKGSL
jgi:hypothetical protein